MARATAGFQPVPDEYSLAQSYPNPFNSTTRIRYVLPRSGHIRLSVYDVLGRTVDVLEDKAKDAGYFTATWDGTDANGRPAASGVYFCALEAPGRRLINKMMLIR